MNLIEIQLFYQGQQIPISSLSISMSSIFSSIPASHCIDGITNCGGGRCDPLYMCCTDGGLNQWLLITCISCVGVDAVKVYNRIDDSGDAQRIKGAALMVSTDSTFSTVTWQATFDTNIAYNVYTCIFHNIITIIIIILIIIILSLSVSQCSSTDGSSCCSYCTSIPCAIIFSSAVTSIGIIIIIINIIIIEITLQ